MDQEIVKRKYVKIPFYFNIHNLQYVPKHVLSYLEAGENNKKIIFCLHGLTRNASDFYFFMKEMSKEYRVISLDVVGRGYSDYLTNKNLYNYFTYVNDIVKLFKILKLNKVNMVGTSMGGIISMIFAARKPDLVSSIVVNDVGPEIPKEALEKIDKYLGKAKLFDNLSHVESHFRNIYKGFGIKEDSHWLHMAENSSFKNSDEKYKLLYDGRISVFSNSNKSFFKKITDLWEFWKKINCPIYLIRGEKSDILTEEIAAKMIACQKNISYKVFDNIGHAPSLYEDYQIEEIKAWIKYISK